MEMWKQTMHLESGIQIAPIWPWRHNLLTWNFFDVAVFLFSILITGPSCISIALLVPELQQFLFIRDWPEILRSEIPLSEFCPVSGDWGELGVPNLAEMFLIKSYLRAKTIFKVWNFYFVHILTEIVEK